MTGRVGCRTGAGGVVVAVFETDPGRGDRAGGGVGVRARFERGEGGGRLCVARLQ